MTTPQQATQTLPGGIIAVYTLEGQNGTLTLRVTGPTGEILGTATNSYANRNDIVLAVSAQLANDFRDVQSEIDLTQQEINQLTAFINNPDNPLEEKVFAERSLAQANTRKATLVTEADNLRSANLQIGSQFFAIVNNLNEAAAPPTTPPTATPTIESTTANAATATTGTNTLQGVASDDSGSQPTVPASAVTAVGGKPSATTDTPTSGTNTGPSNNAPENPAAERDNTPAQNDTQGTPPYPNEAFFRTGNTRDVPGKRLKNPLSFMSSYNYQLSLYVITPDAYDAFLANGRRNLNVFAEQIGNTVSARSGKGGAFLLAQSGGAGPDPRAPGVKYDYYIDNLTFTHLASAKETLGPTGNIEFNFQIIEPYGFSFINNLKKAQIQFDEFAKGTQWGDKSKSSVPIAKQFFILGIRFYGYDAAGVPVLGDESFEGSVLDPDNSGTGAIFETFYELVVYEIKYKIDGKATVYNVRANAAAPSLGANVKKGYVMSPKEVDGSTVRDMLSGPNGLLTKLNEEQVQLKNNKSIEFPTTYKIKYLADAELIALSSMISENRENKANQPANNATNTEGVTPATEVKSSPTSTAAAFNFSKDTPIIQCIDTLFSRSKYIEDVVTVNYTDSNEYDPKTKSAKANTTPKREFKWFRITPNISNVNWDTILNDWSYDITYVVETYLIPNIDSPFVAGTTTYYGPHKRYDYWYTGENSEVISYEQSLDNQFYQEIPAGDPKSNQTPESEGNANRTAQAANSTKNLDLTGAGGTLSTAAVAAVKNALYDPGSYTKATVQILGDPDFLMQEVTAGFDGLNQAYSRHYGDGFTIKPTGGYVFFEIDFKEAVDYSANNVNDVFADGEGITGVGGTLSINDSILFWNYPEGAKDMVKGISYTLTKVKNSFRNGLFTQTLEAFINDFGTGALKKEAATERDEAQTAAGRGGTASRSGSEDQAVSDAEEAVDKAEGTIKDPAQGTGKAANAQPNTSVAEPNS